MNRTFFQLLVLSTMRILLLTILVHITCAKVSVVKSYHASIGIPEAAHIMDLENTTDNTRIINGYHVILGEHPYFAGLVIALTSERVSLCGSTLISHTKLVTAAHCWTDGVDQAQYLEVVLGSLKLFSGGTRITTNRVTVHDLFDTITAQNDIAMITIPQIMFNNNIQPIKLPDASSKFIGIKAQIVGFGRTNNQDIGVDQQLSAAYVTVDDSNECRLMYGNFFGKSMVCTQGGYSSPCNGDSGGPLLYKNAHSQAILIGVVSYGSIFGCDVGHPAVYTKVTKYVDWILSSF